jgi:hypothetical protein
MLALPDSLKAQGYSGPASDLGRHRDFAGKPCLEISAVSRAHVVAPKVFDHVLSVNNRCIELIKAKFCYFKTQQCIDMQIAGRSRKEQVLGSFPSMSQFKYDFKEHF